MSFHPGYEYRRIVPFPTEEDQRNGWIKHIGDGCPVDPNSFVHIMFADGEKSLGPRPAGDYRWSKIDRNGDIVAYKLDPYDRFRQAAIKGEKVMMRNSSGWAPLNFSHTNPKDWKPAFKPEDYKLVKLVKKPLTQDDLPPGSFLKNKSGHTFLVIHSDDASFWTIKQDGQIIPYSFIYSNLEPYAVEYIHANDVQYVNGVLENKWKPCYKEVEELEQEKC
jgi:hypothetical protein